MSKFKSHFAFTKKQRNGILLLLTLIIFTQCFYFYKNYSSKETDINQDDLTKFQKEVDSLRLVQIESSKPNFFLFNPNYITDFMGYSLGMSTDEINRLVVFREQDKWINSVKQFQEVTQMSDSLLDVISPYFKFPDWVNNPKPRTDWANYSKNTTTNSFPAKTYEQKIDLNKATAEQLQKVNGIGAALSDRIIKYRNKFIGGFLSDIQLMDINGLTPEVIERITNDFTVKTPRPIQKINLNTATKEQLVTVQHVDYEIAHDIIEQRTLRDGFKSIDELSKVKGIPSNKIEIIKLYLTLD